MLKVNYKGFTLIEMLAVIIILGVLAVIMVPTVTNLISKNKSDNYDNLENSIISATKMFISDYRYDIQLDDTTVCDDGNKIRNISSIKLSDSILTLDDSKLKISILVDNGYLTTNKDDKILNPKDNNSYLDLDYSYIDIKYNCDIKDYDFTLDNLEWK